MVSTTRRCLPIAWMLALALTLTGCMSWTRGWETETRLDTVRASLDLDAEFASARSSFLEADDAAKLAQVRSALHRLVAQAPSDQRLLLLTAQVEILHGAAYDESRATKASSYRRGIQLAERAMAEDPGFAERIAGGASLAEAASTLGAEDAEAMLLWVTGVSYYFKECLSGLGHVVNLRWARQTAEITSHLMNVAPELEHGAVPFSLGIYFVALPGSAGGDIARAGELLEVAVAQSGSSLLPRWGRAKYYWSKLGDKKRFRDDLEWVLAQNPRSAASPYPWNVYFQRDARRMLERIDRSF
ncbi:MAG: TRAP transporter TatT component family protein [Thermoanaerobaculia bacterium]